MQFHYIRRDLDCVVAPGRYSSTIRTALRRSRRIAPPLHIHVRCGCFWDKDKLPRGAVIEIDARFERRERSW
jgi:hypothetical protein